MRTNFIAYCLLFFAVLYFTGCTEANETPAADASTGSGPNFTEKPSADATYRQADEPVNDRIADLINRMTVEEKVAQVTAVWADKKRMYRGNFDFNPDSAAVLMPYGIGHITRPSELNGPPDTGRTAVNEVAYTNDIQRWLVEETRLGIPALMHEESLHGLAALNATSWGQPISVAASFNRDLTRKLYATAARQAASRGAHVVLTPVVDVARDPRWGRVEETLGEDPYLAAQIGLQAVLGFQGDDDQWDEGEVYATLKHMAGHGEPEGGNNIAPANISERTLREVFLYPFRYIVAEGNVRNIMASYNEVNGIPSHANDWMLNDLLRDQWGYEGAVVSDYYAVRELADRHAVAANWKEAAVRAIESGVDIELPDREAFPYLVEAINDGTLELKVLNTAVGRILKQKFDRGLFENPYTDPAKVINNTAEDNELVRYAGAESIILLKNESILPLKKDSIGRVAVIGPNADRVLLGGYSDIPDHFVTVRDGLVNALGEDRIIYSEGTRVTEPGSWYKDPVIPSAEADERKRIAAAVAASSDADVIILAVGGNELTSREAWAEGHWGDRPTLELVGLQNELIDALSATGKPIIGLVFGGRPLNIKNLTDKASAVFQCFYLGQETGNSVADVIFGAVDPGGRLPISMPRSVGHIPSYYNYKPTARRGYLMDDVSAAWHFGYGLSYTDWKISPPQMSASSSDLSEAVSVACSIENVGDRPGTQVLQLYIRDRVSQVTRPVKELRGFQKVRLEPGESKRITFQITAAELEYLGPEMKWVTEPGEFDIMIGTSSRDEDLQKVSFQLTE